MRVAVVLSAAAVALLAGAMGCKGPKVDPGVLSARKMLYKRLAIVCVPGRGADPAFAELILNSARPNIPTRLGFLTACDCLMGVPTDIAAVPPRVNLADRAANYDAVLCLVYEYGGDDVVLHMYLLDARTGAQVWYYKLSTEDDDTAGRLKRHGFWTPTILKRQFYGEE